MTATTTRLGSLMLAAMLAVGCGDPETSSVRWRWLCQPSPKLGCHAALPLNPGRTERRRQHVVRELCGARSQLLVGLRACTRRLFCLRWRLTENRTSTSNRPHSSRTCRVSTWCPSESPTPTACPTPTTWSSPLHPMTSVPSRTVDPTPTGRSVRPVVWTAAPHRTQRGLEWATPGPYHPYPHARDSGLEASTTRARIAERHSDCQLFVMSLVVDDGLQWSEPDYCTIDVRRTIAPRRRVGPRRVVPPRRQPLPAQRLGELRPDGDPLTYSWSVVSAPAGADPSAYGFVDPSVVAPFFGWDVPGEWSFQLQVSDGNQWSSPDVVTYLVSAEGENNSPTANAGGDQTVIVEANCSTSSYVWTCEQCPRPQVARRHRLIGYRRRYLVLQLSEDNDTLTWSSNSAPVGIVELPLKMRSTRLTCRRSTTSS